MEIVASIHKQKLEVARVILDMRKTEKIINQLNGRISRTFTIADEVIFKVSSLFDDAFTFSDLVFG